LKSENKSSGSQWRRHLNLESQIANTDIIVCTQASLRNFFTGETPACPAYRSPVACAKASATERGQSLWRRHASRREAGSGEQGIIVDNLITIRLQITEVFHSNKKGKANSASPFLVRDFFTYAGTLSGSYT